MLLQLNIRDFVIVDRLEREFEPGFGALTGETGAGKSILIDALTLALGERADPAVVRQGAEKADIVAGFAIEALPEAKAWLVDHDFEVDDEQLLLRRVIEKTGRSRGYINGAPATAQQLREVGELLVDVHGQHAHQSLLRADAQRQLLDQQGGHAELARQVGEAWRAWQQAQAALNEAEAGGEALLREQERLRWQVEELSALNVQAGEWAHLQLEHQRLAHAASLVDGARFALEALVEGESNGLAWVDAACSKLTPLAEIDPTLQAVVDLLESARVEMDEAVSQLRRYGDRVEQDPERLQAMERRIDAILTCARKYKVEPDALPALYQSAQVALDAAEGAADTARLHQQVAECRQAYTAVASMLSDQRRGSAAELGRAVTALMQELALGRGRFEIALSPVVGGSLWGDEQVEFQVGGLAGDALRPMAKVVSGGELSRISLALQVVTSRSASVPTLIFDEVDVGIGGGVAEIVGRMLHALGVERQVLCVTHLPQVAAQANWQWQVSKTVLPDGGVSSRIETLDEAGRVEEIARMLGGVALTETTRQHAREMLGLGKP